MTTDSNKVLALPSKAVREWAGVREVLSDHLWSQGHDSETIGRVVEVVRPIFMKCVDAEGKSISASVLMFDVVNLAIENHRLREALKQYGVGYEDPAT